MSGLERRPSEGAARSEPPSLKELDELHASSANNLAGLYADTLGLSRQEYINSLPRFFPQPEGYRGRFDIPVIVQAPDPKRGLTAERMFEILGIRPDGWDPNLVGDWERDRDGFTTPAGAYTTWLGFGGKGAVSLEEARSSITADGRGGTLFDGLGLFAADPKVLDDKPLHMPGSQVADSDSYPILQLARNVFMISDGPKSSLGYSKFDNTSLRDVFPVVDTKVLFAGRKITTRADQFAV